MATKKIKRKQRLAPENARTEHARITIFTMSELVYSPERTPMAVIFGAYKAWLKVRKFPATKLNLDGFGRMFPPGYTRKVVSFGGKLQRAVIGVEVK